jgi:hypothetical protein
VCAAVLLKWITSVIASRCIHLPLSNLKGITTTITTTITMQNTMRQHQVGCLSTVEDTSQLLLFILRNSIEKMDNLESHNSEPVLKSQAH